VRRQLSPDETQLWAKVMRTVRPLRAVAVAATLPRVTVRTTAIEPQPVEPKRKPMARVLEPRVVPTPPASAKSPSNTLDGGWDKRLARGMVAPDSSIDLHGHTLASAHALLDAGLARAIAGGDRVLLLVTGKPPRPESERPHARGSIRAAIGDWLASSRHAGSIAAVRGAHPRHGGQGALYIVIRRPRAR
jgi:DNA-nicking Smr family endonuclease